MGLGLVLPRPTIPIPNTKSDMAQSRNWCYTINNWKQADVVLLDNVTCNYIQYQHEIGKNGTPHIQGFICFATNKRLAALKKLHPTAHWEPMRGRVSDNLAYTSKDETRDPDHPEVYIRGQPPVTDFEKGETEKARWKKARECATSGDLDQCPDDIYVRYIKNLEHISQLKATYVHDHEQPEWHYGVTGSGKSHYCREVYPENPAKDLFIKSCTKWWNNYAGQPVVLMEDFDKRHARLVHYLKIWTDKYVFPVEVKHSQLPAVRPRKFFITSNYHPREIWSSSADLDPILRRFKIVHYPYKYVPASGGANQTSNPQPPEGGPSNSPPDALFLQPLSPPDGELSPLSLSDSDFEFDVD